jgi:hypothetical protein
MYDVSTFVPQQHTPPNPPQNTTQHTTSQQNTIKHKAPTTVRPSALKLPYQTHHHGVDVQNIAIELVDLRFGFSFLEYIFPPTRIQK